MFWLRTGLCFSSSFSSSCSLLLSLSISRFFHFAYAYSPANLFLVDEHCLWVAAFKNRPNFPAPQFNSKIVLRYGRSFNLFVFKRQHTIFIKYMQYTYIYREYKIHATIKLWDRKTEKHRIFILSIKNSRQHTLPTRMRHFWGSVFIFAKLKVEILCAEHRI